MTDAASGAGVLHLLHGGGGTEQHARALIAASRGECRHFLAIATGVAAIVWPCDPHLAVTITRQTSKGIDQSMQIFVGVVASNIQEIITGG